MKFVYVLGLLPSRFAHAPSDSAFAKAHTVSFIEMYSDFSYRPRANKILGLYTFYPIYEDQKRFFMFLVFFLHVLHMLGLILLLRKLTVLFLLNFYSQFFIQSDWDRIYIFRN